MLESPITMFLRSVEHDRNEAQRKRDAADAQLVAIERCMALANLLSNAVDEARELGFSPRLGLSSEGRVLRFEVDAYAARVSISDVREETPSFQIVEHESPHAAEQTSTPDAAERPDSPAPAPSGSPPVDRKMGGESPVTAAKPKVASNGKYKPWSESEAARLLELKEQGLSFSSIADQMGRSQRAVENKCALLMTRTKRITDRLPRNTSTREAAVVAPSPPPEASKQQAPACAADPVAAAPKSPDWDAAGAADEHLADVPVSDRRAWRRVTALGRGGTWTLAKDIALIEGLTGGRKLAQVAPQVGVSLEACKARFSVLCPDPTFEEQTRVLRLLRQLEAA